MIGDFGSRRAGFSGGQHDRAAVSGGDHSGGAAWRDVFLMDARATAVVIVVFVVRVVWPLGGEERLQPARADPGRHEGKCEQHGSSKNTHQ